MPDSPPLMPKSIIKAYISKAIQEELTKTNAVVYANEAPGKVKI